MKINMPKCLTRGLTGLAVAGAFSGCGGNIYYSSYEGFNVKIGDTYDTYPVYPGIRYLYMKDINGNELIAADVSKDGRYDTINISNLPKGSPLEKYANPQTLKEITDKVLSEAGKNKAEKEESK